MQSLAPAALVALLALSACGRGDAPGARADTTAEPAPNPTVGPLASLVPVAAGDGTRPAGGRVASTGGEGWNAAQIDWQPYEAGLARAKAQKKPVCLVFYTSWCPHCKNYSHVFDDPGVVAKAKELVMIRLDADAEGDVARKFQPDGGYVPRTFFLAPDGTLDPEIHAARPKFLYFFDEQSPASILTAMGEAVRKLAR
jgi:thiol-disulfide isomerase/thioredoxin